MSDVAEDDVSIPGLEGQEIKEVRPMTNEELETEFFSGEFPVPDKYKKGSNPVVIITEGGNKIFPSQDPEGNEPGRMFGDYEGTGYYVEGENPQ